jgi:hypothetical protein
MNTAVDCAVDFHVASVVKEAFVYRPVYACYAVLFHVNSVRDAVEDQLATPPAAMPRSTWVSVTVTRPLMTPLVSTM